MEITKVVKPCIKRGANTFGNIVYVTLEQNSHKLLGYICSNRQKYIVYKIIVFVCQK